MGYNKIYIPIHTLYIPYIPYIPNNKIYIPQPNSSYSHYIPDNKIYIPTTYLQKNIHTHYTPTIKYTYLPQIES